MCRFNQIIRVISNLLLERGDLDGDLETLGLSERFSFTWEGQDEMDQASGSGWMQLISDSEVVRGAKRVA